MKKKFLCAGLVACCLFAMIGCSGKKENDKTEGSSQVESSVETSEVPVSSGNTEENTSETENDGEIENAEAATISPLPSTISLEELVDCTLAVSFEKDDILLTEDGTLQLRAMVYDYELFDLVDVSKLKKNDIILLHKEEITVTSIEKAESGNIILNGGLDVGGFELRTDESGVFYETGYSDMKTYYEIGEITLPFAENFKLTDTSDLDKNPAEYSVDELLKEESEHFFGFAPHNTSIVIENGKIVSMSRVYTP